jgi:hypothetical protein
MRAGPPHVLGGLYVLFAIAAGARSAYQLSTRFAEAPAAYALSAVAALFYVVAAIALRSGRRMLLAWVAAVELAGVLLVGAISVAEPAAFPDETVWSRFGHGYAYLPLMLPIAALAWLRMSRRRTASP